MAQIRNFAGIQFEALRQRIDGAFNALHDALEEAYYGERGADGRWVPGTGWRNGQSKPWMGFDKTATPAASKALFDRLHSSLWTAYGLVFHEENLKQPQPYARERYDTVRDDAGVVIGSRVETARASLRALRTARPDEFAALKNWAAARSFALDSDATV